MEFKKNKEVAFFIFNKQFVFSIKRSYSIKYFYKLFLRKIMTEDKKKFYMNIYSISYSLDDRIEASHSFFPILKFEHKYDDWAYPLRSKQEKGMYTLVYIFLTTYTNTLIFSVCIHVKI